jgi:sugar phosphate isomerase/epimerase
MPSFPALPCTVSFSTLGCPAIDWSGLCALGARFGIHSFELRALGGQLDLPGYLQATFGTPECWAAAVTAAGARICAFDTSLKLIGSDPGERAAMLAFLPWAEATGGALLRVFDGGDSSAGLSPAAADQALQTIDWWRNQRRQHGWRSDIMIETHDALITGARIAALQQQLEEPLAILWDSHHTWKKGGEDPAATWQVIQPWVRHVHVKDSISTPSARHPFTYVLPGAGEFPLAATLRLLRTAGYSGVLSLEWELLWHPYLGAIAPALAALADRCADC